ncbi:MAG: hypothetical protein AAF490_29310 [Chloroflexota bacterium]
MYGRATATALLAEMKNDTTQLFRLVEQQSQNAGVDHTNELSDIATMIEERRYATARVYLETMQERLPN